MRIVAVGGGDKTAAIKAALQDTENTRTLIIPSACSTERSYNTKVPKIVKFFRDLGIACTVLHELQETPLRPKSPKSSDRPDFCMLLAATHPPCCQGLPSIVRVRLLFKPRP
jgi:hypothetical protein